VRKTYPHRPQIEKALLTAPDDIPVQSRAYTVGFYCLGSREGLTARYRGLCLAITEY